MSNQEDDYMSDSFLKVQEKKAEPYTFKKRKAPEIQKIPSLKERETKSREEGLSTPLPEDNKGFKMLKMMGYQKGTSLGKQSASSTSNIKDTNDTLRPLIDPLAITIKQGRLGLGIEEQENQKVDEMMAKQPAMTQEMLSSFRSTMQSKFSDKKMQGDLYKALKLCFRMDTDSVDNSSTPKSSPFYKDKTEFDEEELKIWEESKTKEVIIERPDFAQLQLSDKLEKVLKYLRSTYLYCFYCGSKFASEEELEKRCPGLFEDDH